MTAVEAALAVLRSEPGSELHWTVIWDRALRSGAIDPRTDPDARAKVVAGLAEAAREGIIERTSKGTYRAPA